MAVFTAVTINQALTTTWVLVRRRMVISLSVLSIQTLGRSCPTIVYVERNCC